MIKWLLPVLVSMALCASGANEPPTWKSGKKYTVSSKVMEWVYYENLTKSLIICPKGSGHATEYIGVPEPLFEDFMNARMKGSIYNGRIKGKFPTRKVWVKQRDG